MLKLTTCCKSKDLFDTKYIILPEPKLATFELRYYIFTFYDQMTKLIVAIDLNSKPVSP